jgi:hypothetical protein
LSEDRLRNQSFDREQQRGSALPKSLDFRGYLVRNLLFGGAGVGTKPAGSSRNREFRSQRG